jgi:TRAP-type transport system periplasmic protein
MRKTIFRGAVILMASVSVLVGSSYGKNSDEIILKIGFVVNENDPICLGVKEFKKNVEARTKGKMKIEVYPGSQLGDTKDIMEQAKLGANIGAISDAALMSEIVPELGVLAAPYSVKNYAEARKLVTSDLYRSWCEKTKKGNYKILSFNWYQGARHFLTNKPIKKPEDLKGLRIRTPGSPIFTDSINAMGANATSLAWGEVYTGIQQKVIDGCEAQLPAIVSGRVYEQCKYLSKTEHFQLMTPLIVGAKFYENLPAEFRKILDEEATKAGDFAANLVNQNLLKNEQMMKDAGVTIIEVDKKPFIAACQSVYQKNKLTDLKKQIDQIIAKK